MQKIQAHFQVWLAAEAYPSLVDFEWENLLVLQCFDVV